MAFCSTWRQTTVCKRHRGYTPRMLSHEMRRLEAVVNNHRPLCLQHVWYDAKVEQEAFPCGDILVYVST